MNLFSKSGFLPLKMAGLYPEIVPIWRIFSSKIPKCQKVWKHEQIGFKKGWKSGKELQYIFWIPFIFFLCDQ